MNFTLTYRKSIVSFFSFWSVLILGLSIATTSCTNTESQENASIETILVTDDLGRTLEITSTPQRIITLAPSLTEHIYFLGADSLLVARTQACNYPPQVDKLPVISTYPLDIEGIIKLQPDVVFSVDGIVNVQQVKKLEELGINVFFLKYTTIDDIHRSIITLGSILGKGKRASFLVDSLHTALNKIKVETSTPLSVLNITWTKPIFIYGKDTPFTDKIMAAGGKNAIDQVLHSPYPEVTREYILQINPDVIVGYDFEKMDSSFFRLYPELKQINAYQKKQVFDVNDNLMSRPSPRYIESILELKKILMQCE